MIVDIMLSVFIVVILEKLLISEIRECMEDILLVIS